MKMYFFLGSIVSLITFFRFQFKARREALYKRLDEEGTSREFVQQHLPLALLLILVFWPGAIISSALEGTLPK